MADWTDCPNCGEEVRGYWVYPEGSSWDGPPDKRPYVVPYYDGLHFTYECKGSFESGAAVAFGLIGMAEAIRRRIEPCSHLMTCEGFCERCGAVVTSVT